MVCKNCGANIPNGELFCPNCGTRTENAKFCKYCGAVIGADCVVCPACGRQVEPLQSAQQSQPVYVNNNVTYGGVAKSKWTAFFLCLFLGLIGAHKFYEGKIGMGVLYIFTGGLFGIGAFVDLIKAGGASIPVRSMVTPTSKNWTLAQLLLELNTEHETVQGDKA